MKSVPALVQGNTPNKGTENKPKGGPKPTFIGFDKKEHATFYKQPPKPKDSPKTSPQDKQKVGDLVKPANPKALSVPLGKIKIVETPKDYFPNGIPLEDGSIYIPPKKKRTY